MAGFCVRITAFSIVAWAELLDRSSRRFVGLWPISVRSDRQVIGPSVRWIVELMADRGHLSVSGHRTLTVSLDRRSFDGSTWLNRHATVDAWIETVHTRYQTRQ
jgi:hypothetical protein